MTAHLYQYQYRHAGTVKAYKRMTPEKALARNRDLEARGGFGRWVLGGTSVRPEHDLELLKAA